MPLMTCVDEPFYIGALAEHTGVSASAIRYYEAAGLLGADTRTEAGYRVYGRQAARRLDFIRRAKSLGFKLAEIKRLIDAPRSAPGEERAFFDRIVESKIDETQSRIASLRKTTRELRGLASSLAAHPPPKSCHVGDCPCWLPT